MKKTSFTKGIERPSIFGEGIERRSTAPRRESIVARPRWLLCFILLLVFSVLGMGRIADLQLLRGSYFRSLSDGNRIRRIPIRAPRGEILDRNGQAFGRNVPVYKLAEFSSGGVVVSTAEITREEALKIQSSDSEQASRLLVDIAREYPLAEAAAHLVGYVSEVSEVELVEGIGCQVIWKTGDRGSAVFLGDLIGRMGIEQYYDCLLRGVNGEELLEVDTRGKIVRRLGRRAPVSGQTIKLSIDSDLQKASYEALIAAPELAFRVGGAKWIGGDVARGAVVAQDPNTGGILALVSVPSFDPGKISEEYGKLREDKGLPLFNRAIGGAYHPGSTFKIVTSTAALEDGKIDSEFTYQDTGVVTAGAFSYSNWYFSQYGRTEGVIGLQKAIARSTDTFFYKLGELVGPDRLAFWARKFGYGEKSGIDLLGEVSGLVPDSDWKLKTKGERWFLGNTYHMAIGQGDVASSPLQVNRMTGVIASGGVLCTPHIISEEAMRNFQFPISNFQCQKLELKKETIDQIVEGMRGACSTGGTAFTFFNFNPPVACKTGTAQTVGGQTHAWLTVFGSDIALTVLIEEGGEGSRVAGPVAVEIMRKWYNTP